MVIRAILLPISSVNHRFLSGPVTIHAGRLPVVGTVYSVTAPATVMRPTLLLPSSVNHILSSGPRVIEYPLPNGLVTGYSLSTVPVVVMRPILLISNMVYQMLPSGP